MNRLTAITVAAVLLAGCMTLPGSDLPAPRRYVLQSPVDDCESGNRVISLSIVRVAAGLNTDRVARRDAATGAFSVLKDVRWVDRTAAMLEQRLAEDLECKGYTVLTSHHSRLSHDQLICEVRAMNLVAEAGAERAEVALSCLYFQGPGHETAIQAAARSPLRSWQADAAAAAASEAYAEVFAELVAGLPE